MYSVHQTTEPSPFLICKADGGDIASFPRCRDCGAAAVEVIHGAVMFGSRPMSHPDAADGIALADAIEVGKMMSRSGVSGPGLYHTVRELCTR